MFDFAQVKTMVTEQLFKQKGDSVLGIDIGSSAIKIVQLRKTKGAAVLETYGEIALGPYTDLEVGRATNLPAEKLAEALKDLIREANVTTTNCGASIPFASSLVTLIELPAVGASKLAEMIPIEARKYIPVPIGEVQLDWFVVPEAESKFFTHEATPEGEEGAARAKEPSKQEKSLVLIVAIHNEVLRKYTETLKLAGLEPSFYEIEVFSSIRSTIERGIAPVAIIDIGAATSKVFVVELGVVLSSHVINRGSQDVTLSLSNSNHLSVTRAEEMKREMGLLGGGSEQAEGTAVSHAATLAMEYIFIEARHVILNYQKKHNKAVQKVIITGGGATMKGLEVFAHKQLELDIEMADPFSLVQTPAFIEGVLQEAGPDFAVAVGLALRRLQEVV